MHHQDSCNPDPNTNASNFNFLKKPQRYKLLVLSCFREN